MNLHDIIEAATPGPWTLGKGTKTIRKEGTTPVWAGFIANTHLRDWTRNTEEADARHIATFDPTLTAAMLAVCEAAALVTSACERGDLEPSGSMAFDCTVCGACHALCALESLLTERGLTMGGD